MLAVNIGGDIGIAYIGVDEHIPLVVFLNWWVCERMMIGIEIDRKFINFDLIFDGKFIAGEICLQSHRFWTDSFSSY